MLRVFLGLFICLCIGAVVVSGFHYAGAGGLRQILFWVIWGATVAFLTLAAVVVAQPWKVETGSRQLLFMLGSLSVGLSLAAWAQSWAGKLPDGSSMEQMIVAEAAALLFIWVFLRIQHLSWSEAFGLANRRRQAIVLGVLLACFFLPLGDGLQWASAKVMESLKLQPQEQQAVHALRVASTWSHRLLLAMLALLLAPVLEEVAFRGVLYPAIKQAGFPRLALWTVSVIFASVHANMATFIPLLVLALLLTWLYERTDNLLAPITAHALFNVFNFAKLYLLEWRLGP